MPDERRKGRQVKHESSMKKKKDKRRDSSLLLDDVAPVPGRFGASRDKRVHRVIVFAARIKQHEKVASELFV
jgi:hypothetical protein